MSLEGSSARGAGSFNSGVPASTSTCCEEDEDEEDESDLVTCTSEGANVACTGVEAPYIGIGDIVLLGGLLSELFTLCRFLEGTLPSTAWITSDEVPGG